MLYRRLSLRILNVKNIIKQEASQSDRCEETSSIIKYPHLTNLYFGYVHIDSNLCLPCLKELYIQYEDLVAITENFTRSAICSKVKHINFGLKTMVLPKEFCQILTCQ